VPCFTSGAETGSHRCATHNYQVIEQNSYPIFTEDWGADEELLLLQGAETYGLGSWADIADHIGGARDRDEVRDHYLNVYIDSSKFPLPEHSDPDDRTFSEISREEFQSRKKQRIETRKEEALKSTPSAPKKKPTASVPACHEIQGYMPGRLEFETEFDNEAEMAVKDLFFEPGDGVNPNTGAVEPEVDLKCTVMDIYNHKLTQRAQRKKVMFEHGLLEYRKNAANEKKKTKDERDLLNKAKPFGRIMNKRDFDAFSEGLLQEHNHRLAVAQLQEWRRMGIHTLQGGQNYEVEKIQRVCYLGCRPYELYSDCITERGPPQ
jgi:transcriptional adapter 2-alpha